MNSENLATPRKLGVAMDKFFFFFFGLRRSLVRERVTELKRNYPGESPEQLARRLINADTSLSLFSGALLHLPMLAPGVGLVFRLLGVAAVASAMTGLHIYLILEIALLFGRDIDDAARVPEILAIIAASGLTSGTPWLLRSVGLKPLLAVPVGTLTVAATRRLVVEAAIRYYRRTPKESSAQWVPAPAGATSHGA